MTSSVPCKNCGDPTPSLHTRLCEHCFHWIHDIEATQHRVQLRQSYEDRKRKGDPSTQAQDKPVPAYSWIKGDKWNG